MNPTRFRRFLIPLRIVVIAILMVAAITVTAQTPAPATQDVAGLSLSCPVPLGKGNKIPLDPSVPVQEMLSFRARSDGADIVVTYAEYKEGTPVSLDAAIEKVVTGMSKLPGSTSHKHTTEAVSMPGANAKRLTLTMMHNGKELCVNALAILKADRMWLVQSIFPGADQKARSVGEGAINSARLPQALLFPQKASKQS